MTKKTKKSKKTSDLCPDCGSEIYVKDRACDECGWKEKKK